MIPQLLVCDLRLSIRSRHNARFSVFVSADTPVSSSQKLCIFEMDNIFFGSNNPTHILSSFRHKITGTVEARPSQRCRTSSQPPAVLPFSKLNRKIFGYFDPENIFIDNKNK